MEGRRLIESIAVRNLLSFGLKQRPVELNALNVLIGPNGSGKSNFIAVLDLLRAMPRDFAVPFREGGAIDEWRWQGAGGEGASEVIAVVPYAGTSKRLCHWFTFTTREQRLWLMGEFVYPKDNRPLDSKEKFFERVGASPRCRLAVRSSEQQPLGDAKGREIREMDVDKLGPQTSVLQAFRSPWDYPEITYLSEQYASIRLYRDWRLGPKSPPRRPQPTDLPGDFLSEDASNLALVLNDLERRSSVKQAVIANLRKLCPRVTDVKGLTTGGTVLTYFEEEGLDQLISAARVSDGVLRFLSLLTILCHPEPPPLVCIEEPELGLHPDILPAIAKLLVEASQQMQLIVTTHSDVLVSALSDVPESILVCERDEEGTKFRRLEKAKLAEWLDKYSLGELWRMGEIGGTVG